MKTPLTIESDAIVDDEALQLLLTVTGETLDRARRSGSLRFSRQGGRVFYLGAWVNDWLRGTSQTGEGGNR
jgi:hypothetical protein